MRKLNELEIEMLTTLRKRKKISKHLFSERKELKVQYRVDGNATLVVIEGRELPLLGFAKFNPKDLVKVDKEGNKKKGINFDTEIGRRIAFTRALKGEK